MFAWLDGKKTVIAATLLTISAFLTQVLVGIWGVSVEWLPYLIQTLDWVGMFLGGAGLTHKAMKASAPSA